MAHSISTFLILLTTIFLTFTSSSSSSSSPSANIFPASAISAAPLSLSSSPPPALSPSVSPLFPTPQLSPTESSLPIIPSNPSPPKPDDDAMAAQGPVMAVAPSRFSADSSSLRMVSGVGCFSSVMVVSGLVLFGLM